MTSLTDTQVITASGGLVELGRTAKTSDVTLTTTVGSVCGPVTVVCDGSPILVEYFCSQVDAPLVAGSYSYLRLDEDGSEKTRYWGVVKTPSSTGAAGNTVGASFHLSRVLTPSAGSHTYEVKGATGGGTGYAYANTEAATTGTSPAFLRVSKIVQATQWPAVTTGTIICTSSTRPAAPFEGQTIYETDNSRQLVWDGSGWVAPSVTYRPPMCKASGNTTVPDSSDTTCSFSTEVFDTDGIFSPTSTDFTIQTAGVYLFTAEVNFNGTVNYRGDVYIQKNGSGWRARTTQYGTVERFPVTVADNASVGDVYTVRVYQDNTTNASKTCSVIFSALWQGQP
jgi:hypothetical protein